MPNNSIALNQNAGALSSADFKKSPSNNQEVSSQFEQKRKRNRQELEQMIERNSLQDLCKSHCLYLFDTSDSLFSYYQLSALRQVSIFAALHGVGVLKVKTSGEFEIEFETSFHTLKVSYNELDLYDVQLTYKVTEVRVDIQNVHVNGFDKIMNKIASQTEEYVF